MSVLSQVLAQLRHARGLSQSDLADELGISRGYYSLLESSGDKEPSLEFLRKLAGVLVGEPLNTTERIRDASKLGLAALGYEYTDPFRGLTGTLDDEVNIQGKPDVEELWIISEIIGETIHGGVLDQTVANLLRNPAVKYTYFVPHGTGQWDLCLDLIESKMDAIKVSDRSFLADGRLRAIACPPLMCVVPIRIKNPGTSSGQATITLGQTADDLLFYTLEQSQRRKLVTELTGVVNGLEMRSPWELNHASYERLYPPKEAG